MHRSSPVQKIPLWHRYYLLLKKLTNRLLSLNGPVPLRHASLDGLKSPLLRNPDRTDVIRDVVPALLTEAHGLRVANSVVLARLVPGMGVVLVRPGQETAVRPDLRVMVVPLVQQPVPVRYS
jgi:hypothetical protein